MYKASYQLLDVEISVIALKHELVYFPLFREAHVMPSSWIEVQHNIHAHYIEVWPK